MSPWHRLLERPHSGGHFVQLYAATKVALINNAGRYLSEGLRRGEGVLVIATAEHQQCFSRHLTGLGIDVRDALASGQLVFLDAEQSLNEFMSSGQPAWTQFERTILGGMRQVRPQEGVECFRAYGEMVGLLWKTRRFAAAIRVEQFWNKLLEQSAFSLFCSYAIDIFGDELASADLDGVLCTHTHLIPADMDGKLEAAVNQSMDEILGGKAAELRLRIQENSNQSRAVIPAAESAILWLRRNLPAHAEAIVSRARKYYLPAAGAAENS